MDITVYPGKLSGRISAIPSKSQAHRALICAAFSDRPTKILCSRTSRDIEATAECLQGFGAQISRTGDGYHVSPVKAFPRTADFFCKESGTTLRFLLPVAAALGMDATFHLSGRLPYRPISPLWELLTEHGCTLTRTADHTIVCQGKLQAGIYTIDGGVSSQFISGLLFAMALMPGTSQLQITGAVESAPYISMTLNMLALYGAATEGNTIRNSYPFKSPESMSIEGDWSSSAFFLAANALGSNIHVAGLEEASFQGDRVVADILKKLHDFITIDAADIPDLVPILAVTACRKQGAHFINTRRLRLKESDRVESTAALLRSLGAEADISENTMTVKPAVFRSCTVDAMADHRIAMAAAIAATVATGPVTILGAECVDKSYPGFWEDFGKLGGSYVQHIR